MRAIERLVEFWRLHEPDFVLTPEAQIELKSLHAKATAESKALREAIYTKYPEPRGSL